MYIPESVFYIILIVGISYMLPVWGRALGLLCSIWWDDSMLNPQFWRMRRYDAWARAHPYATHEECDEAWDRFGLREPFS